jgi:hypothetical protein
MDLQIQGDIRRSKRKLSIFLDSADLSSFSQNPSISTPAEKKKKVSFFSQNQPTQDIQNIPIYSESPLFEDSESAIKTKKSQLFVEILKKTSFDLSQYSELSSPIYSRTLLGPKNTNIQLSQTVAEYIRKPDQKISWGYIRKWQKSQPNDHTSKSFLLFIYLFITLCLPSFIILLHLQLLMPSFFTLYLLFFFYHSTPSTIVDAPFFLLFISLFIYLTYLYSSFYSR